MRWEKLSMSIIKHWIAVPRVIRLSIIPIAAIIVAILGWVKYLKA
jgi:hypothetical protein